MSRKTAPLSSFTPWDGNPRGTELNEEHVVFLQNSIRNAPKGEINLHQNLIGAPKGRKIVTIGGGHRLEALIRLANAGEIAWSTEIPYEEKKVDPDDHEAVRIALEENSQLPMHAVDIAHSYWRMANGGKKIIDIANTFGITELVARQRVALGGLPQEALNLIRAGQRTIAWGKAMTAADTATRKKILSDIAASPTTWKDEQEIRKFLNEDSIPAAHALFDESMYLGPILRDMFEGNRFQDRTEFWLHQNAAIDGKKAALETEGWSRVIISHQPVETWKYGHTDDKSKGVVIIEVAPNGKVTVYDGLIDHAVDAANANDVIESDEDSAGASSHSAGISAGMLEYGRTVRSAVVQAEIANNPRKALEIVVAGLLGHNESPFRMLRARLKGDARLRQGPAFEKVAKNQAEVAQAMTEAGDAAGIEGFVAGLDDTALNALFAKLVADRVVMPAKGVESNLLNAIGVAAGSMRQHWYPTITFLSSLSAEELRHTALSLLPVDRQRGIVSARKNQLVPTLVSLFDEAKSGLPTLDKDAAERINNWAPAWLAFTSAETQVSGEDFLSAFGEESAAA